MDYRVATDPFDVAVYTVLLHYTRHTRFDEPNERRDVRIDMNRAGTVSADGPACPACPAHPSRGGAVESGTHPHGLPHPATESGVGGCGTAVVVPVT